MSHEFAQPTPEAFATEQALITQTQADGDAAGAAFGQLFEAHRADLVRSATRLVGPNDAEDVVQTTALKALRDFQTFDSATGDFGPWVGTITRNTAIDGLRRKHPPTRGLLGNPNQLQELVEAPNTATPEDIAIRRDGITRIENALSKLPPVHASVIRALYLEGLTLAEYRDREQIADGTAKTRHMKAKRCLAELIAAGEINLSL